ncbi:Organization of cell wall [Planctomycetales bacterium 10988]|nr:Organization of cell wall [Planctomycetales bacterium 10988]
MRSLSIIGIFLLLISLSGVNAKEVVNKDNQQTSSLLVLPETVHLDHPSASQRLIVQRTQNNQVLEQQKDVIWQSLDESIVTVENGLIKPVSNGRATILITKGTQTAEVEVTVTGMKETISWNFRNHVLPILAKNACNSGACHGALAGKGGFRLSLRGYDPKSDHFNITQQSRGRRIELSDPGRSLLLTKPTGLIPHKGGLRLKEGSQDYQIIADWISQGASAPADSDPNIVEVKVFPKNVTLQKGDEQQILVQAVYSDGRIEDVTRWAKFSSADESVAMVNESGEVSVIGAGEGAIVVWFSSQIALTRVTSPYDQKINQSVYQESPRRNFIDELVLQKLEELNIPPSGRADDTTFIRRAYLDTIGTLPTPAEVKKFIEDTNPNKRDVLIDYLLNTPEFVTYWTYRWSDVLLVNGTLLRPEPLKIYYEWIRGHVKANTPWDEMVREIVTAQGSSVENGATNFYALHQDPENMTENVSQAFLGLSIACAKCHNHPLEKWTNDQYYAMANLFSRVRAKGWGGDGRNGDGIRTLYVAPSGELLQPLTGKPQPPTPLDGEPLPFDSTQDRRIHLANWLTSPENPYFSKAITNRIWANYFGVGLVEQVDDLRLSNPASNEELLTAASEYLIEKDFNLKALMKAILQSETYQRSSLPLEENISDKRFYSHYYPKRLMAEVLLDAICQVTEIPNTFDEILMPGGDRKETDFYPKGTKALELYDSAVDSYFLKTFGRNTRQITCECERSNEPTMVQVLHLSNGTTINEKIQSEQSRVQQYLNENYTNDEIIDEVFLLGLARYPTPQEEKQLLKLIETAPNRREGIEDLFWAVMSSREFLFNH